MNLASVIILGIIAVAVVAVAVKMWKKGGCRCEGCGMREECCKIKNNK